MDYHSIRTRPAKVPESAYRARKMAAV